MLESLESLKVYPTCSSLIPLYEVTSKVRKKRTIATKLQTMKMRLMVNSLQGFLSPATEEDGAPEMPEAFVQPEPSRTSQQRGSAPLLTPNRRNLNKKPKSIGEVVVDLQKESQSILEKKLEATLEHWKLKLEFHQQESERQFALEQQKSNRRFALESRCLNLEQ